LKNTEGEECYCDDECAITGHLPGYCLANKCVGNEENRKCVDKCYDIAESKCRTEFLNTYGYYSDVACRREECPSKNKKACKSNCDDVFYSCDKGEKDIQNCSASSLKTNWWVLCTKKCKKDCGMDLWGPKCETNDCCVSCREECWQGYAAPYGGSHEGCLNKCEEEQNKCYQRCKEIRAEYEACKEEEQLECIEDRCSISPGPGPGPGPGPSPGPSPSPSPSPSPLLESFDWRNKDGKNWTTPIKNQGRGPYCVVFGAIGAVEARYKIEKNNPGLNPDLSEQYIVSCERGIITTSGFETTDETCFPYQASEGDCSDKCSDWNTRLWKATKITYVHNADTNRIKAALVNYGPLDTSMSIRDWNPRTSSCPPNARINHAVVIVGYDDTEGVWIIRNSWGSTWNGDGHLKVKYGSCAIDDFTVYEGIISP